MTTAQRNFFFGGLWPKACRVQGWSGLQAEAKRRESTLLATTELKKQVPSMRRPTDSMSDCDQDQLTAVFNYAKWLGDPNNIGKARAVVDTAEAQMSDACRRYIFKINELGFTSGYIERIAAWDCRACGVSDWQSLPVEKDDPEDVQPGDEATRLPGPGLRRVLIHLTQRRQEKKQPRTEPGEVVEYQMKPSKIFTPAVRRETAENPY